MLVFNDISPSRKIRIIGFFIENLKIDGKKIDNTFVIAFLQTAFDWFDIKMTV
jgi:hypothetical protein